MNPARTVVIVYNRFAGDGKSIAMLADAQSELSYRWVTIDCTRTDTLFASLAALDPVLTSAIVVFGGDGTLNRCLPALRECPIPIYLFPVGTVNDLAFQLGLEADWKQVVSMIDQARYTPVRVLEVNGCPFAVYGALGFGADMSRYMRRTRGLLGPLRRTVPLFVGPILTLAAILLSRGPRMLRIVTDTESLELSTPGLYIANRSRFNRTIDLGWDPECHPGKFRAIVFKAMSRRKLCRTMTRLAYFRRLEAIRDSVMIIDTSEMLIESMDDSPLRMFAEGEPVAEGLRLSINAASRSMLFFGAAKAE